MDISAEIAAIQAASQGSELRQPLVGALNKLNSGSLPAVTASDAGKILKVGANGWEVGEKSGYMPIPTGTKQITENGTHDVTNYASAVVDVSGGGGSTLITKTITENGTYEAINDNANGYSSVYVNVKKFIDPLDYLTNSNYYVGHNTNASPPIAVEYYYGTAIETVASFPLIVGHKYILSLDNNPGTRFRRGMFTDRPFTVIPSPLPAPTGQIVIQGGDCIFTGFSTVDYGNDPKSYSAIAFIATRPYLAIHLSTSGQTHNVYLVQMD